MQYLPSKLALTAPLAALLWAIPVSLDLTRSHATADRAELIGIGLKIDSAEARVGRRRRAALPAWRAAPPGRPFGRSRPTRARPLLRRRSPAPPPSRLHAVPSW